VATIKRLFFGTFVTVGKRSRVLVLALCLAPPTTAASQRPPTEHDGLGSFLDSLMVDAGIPGISFALFDDRGILFEYVGGVKSRATGEAIGTETVFEAASISKPVFAYIVLSLVRDGEFGLDQPLGSIISEVPEVAYDSRSEALTPRVLLTHQGGLPNWRSRLNFDAESFSALFGPQDTLRFVADPNSEYLYSGEGYVLLQRVVQERTGTDLTELAKVRVFDPLGMARTSFQFDSEMRLDYASGHDRGGNPDKWEIRLPLASSTLHTTAPDLAAFGVHLASQIQAGGPFSLLAEPAVGLDEAGQEDLSWGLGLGIVSNGSRRYVYHGGNNVIFIADFMYGVAENLGYALLTNSANGQRIIGAVEARVFGRTVGR
jgi:CubicO group peptidase (beta-lactamase class C family)